MNCWHCNKELIWGGDHDTEDNEDYDIVSNLSCPNCHTAVDVPPTAPDPAPRPTVES